MPFPRMRESCRIALFALAVWGVSAHAAGLGPIAIQSTQGQPLLATIPLPDPAGSDDGTRCITATVTSPDGASVITPTIELTHSNRSHAIRLSTSHGINAPVWNIAVAVGCNDPVRREYPIRLKPPEQAAAHSSSTAKPDGTAPAKIPSNASKASHGVLKLSTLTTTNKSRDLPLRLRLSDGLTLSAIAPRMLDAPAAPAQLMPPADDKNAIQSEQILLKNLRAEAQALRAETARMKQQNNSYKQALESARNKSFNWIKGLGILLAVCIAAVGWLLWRVIGMKKTAQHSWHELFTHQDINTIDSALLGGNTEFGTTGFNMTEINTEEFRTTGTLPDSPLLPHIKENSPTTGKSESIPTYKAEEIADIMELVDIWMARNAPEKALELLKPFSEEEQPESPLPWLCLLDVYRALGDQQKYEAVLRRIKAIFNVKLAPWETPADAEPTRTLADFPHVIDEIINRWQSEEVVPYMKKLLLDDRDGTRHGFDLPVYHDILRLIALAEEPGRLQRRDELMQEEAYQILFTPDAEEPSDQQAPPPAHQHSAQPPDTKEDIAGTPVTAVAAVASEEAETAPLPARPVKTIRKTIVALNQQPQDAVPEVGENPPSAAADNNDMSPMAIKLHLAIAYQDIGDKEGACLLLDEVIHNGTPEQSEQARQILAQLT